jgi:hypothetical protein
MTRRITEAGRITASKQINAIPVPKGLKVFGPGEKWRHTHSRIMNCTPTSSRATTSGPCTDAELALGGAWFPFDQLEHAKAYADGARLASPALMRRPEARELPGVQHLRGMIKT